MSMTFTKLFSSITESSVWFEPDHVRLAWITMLAMADRNGRVFASVPGLAHRARIDIAQAQEAIKCFMSPDKYSRTRDFDGRRIEEIDGGWRLLNYLKFRQVRDEEAAKEAKRKYINHARASARETDQVSDIYNVGKVSTVEQRRLSPSASASASEGGQGETKAVRLKFTPPTLEEVRLHFHKIGVPVSEAEGFIAHHSQRNWIPRGSTRQMTSWQHAATTWKINWQKGAFEPRPTGKSAPAEKSILDQDIENLLR